jgi:hypothetical protein
MREEAKANIANRFLIEYVAARPPLGLRPISLSVFDELMALAALIFDYGTESDLIHFGLADILMRMLPSGRLGANREAFDRIREAYSVALSVRHVDSAKSAFARLWNPSAAPSNRAPEVVELDEATFQEFGLPLSEISDFMGELVNVAFDHRRVVVLEFRELREKLGKRLSWPDDKVSKCLELFSLFPRDDYLRPPDPHRRRDLEPWNFNRSMSYLRKPLVHRDGSVLYGYRNVIGAREYLIDLCLSGRLHARTDRMKR